MPDDMIYTPDVILNDILEQLGKSATTGHSLKPLLDRLEVLRAWLEVKELTLTAGMH